ncbi:hypothetical protein RvY_11934 [Ramazzottius varieornatus]|uniref:PiggyBac transposable element-derived protein domain-containing protein n=1 Tax=Ramazzottius varieornatus TaxID=947166 RepID=A0A1D1VHR2_RAMVA|nr:hypothetical protein RvY_11934 [Ramazzottius varieornatus]
MSAKQELATAFVNQGLILPRNLVPFMEAASHGLEGREARFAIYAALSSQILNVEKTIDRDGPKCVLVYPDAVFEYIRKVHGGEVKGGSGQGRSIVNLHLPEDDSELLDEPDLVETGDEQTDTESDDGDILYQLGETGPHLSRNGAVEWARFPTDSGKARSVNRMTGPGGVSARARSQVSKITDSLGVLFTPSIKYIIIRFTKEEGELRYGKQWATLDATELDAYLGILLLQGVYHDGTVPVSELWSESDGKKIYQACMPRDRFAQVTCSLRLDDKRTRNERLQTHKMAHVREVFYLWSDRLRSGYFPYQRVCVDEQLFPFKGRCGFKQYIPTKPRRKYGHKLFLLCCCQTSYCCNIQLYTGKPVGEKAEKNQEQRVVLDLVEHFGSSWGRNATTDNFFTSLALGEALLKRNISLIGTMRKNKPEIPFAFLPSKLREVFSSQLGHTSGFTLVSYVPKKGTAVILLSSMHPDA